MTGAGSAIQAVHRAVRVDHAVAPYDTAHVTVHYAARAGVPVDPVGTLAPAVEDGQRMPIVVFAPGMNCDPSYYRWLAVGLAQAGFAAVTYTFVAEVPPAQFGITPGVDAEAVKPDTYGTRPVGRAIAPILRVMAELDAEGPLAGSLDLEHVALGGHSAGGTVVLESASADFFPQVRAVFSYASHTMASTVFGWPAGSVLPLSGDCPVLMIGASHDALMSAAARWYGEDAETFDPIGRSFDTLPDQASAKGSWHVKLKGANHFSVCAPEDGLWPRAGEDGPAEVPGHEVRTFLVAAITEFCRYHLCRDSASGDALEVLFKGTPFVEARSR